ncbi:tumor suppressor candidate 3-like [Artemia franciscana]|uniref:Magnesium transporter protein 1 n=1 Tax=Artemia franciscana TaxID=6661 RepID=A0AA88LLC9_ARTSF|nr:hypothetical protein QYM36_000729 [Artemia franciscana]
MKTVNLIFGVCLLLTSSECQRKKDVIGASSLAEKVEQLMDLTARKPIIKLNGAKFKEYVRSSPRNYSVIVMFTALSPQRQCVICKQTYEEYTIVANSYKYSMPSSNKLFFGMVDFDDAQDIFQLMRLNTAPVVMHFPPKGKPKKSDTMDIQRVGFGADAMAKWIGEQTEVQIRVLRPPNYSGTIALLTLFGLVAALLYLRRNNLEFLYNKNMWAFISVVFVLVMISGQMWNHIRGPPFLHRNQNGGIAYVHHSSQGQFVFETYIIFAIYAGIAFSLVIMTEAASGDKGDGKKKRIYAVVGLVMFAVFFSLLLSIFRSKAGGYPYSFLFK